MSVIEDMRTYLLTQSGITSLISTRIYYDNLPQNATLPALVVYQAGEDLVRHLAAADTLSKAAVQVDIYADSYSDAASVSDAVTTAVEFDSGTWGSSSVVRAYVENISDASLFPRDGSEQWHHLRILSCGVWVA